MFFRSTCPIFTDMPTMDMPTMKDWEIQLLTAFVDGELTPRERKAVHRLLNRSSDARAMLQQLQENAYKLKQLPAHRLPPDFAAAILQAIQTETEPAPKPVLSARRAPFAAAFVPLAATAAAVLLAVTASVYYFFASQQESPAGPVADNKFVSEPVPGLRVELALEKLRDSVHQQHLTDELRREPGFHLDLKVNDSVEMVAQVKDALKSKGIDLLVDATAQADLKQGKKADYLIYLENIAPEEATAVLTGLGAEGHGTLSVHTFSAEDRKLLAGLLREESSPIRSTDEKGKLLLDTFIPAPKGTDAGKNPLPVVAPGRLALVLSMAQDTPSASAAFKEFVQKRGALQTGTVQLLVVVRQV